MLSTNPNSVLVAQARQQGRAGQRSAGGASGGSAVREEQQVGKYRIIKTLGRGNFARVKLARHVLTGREVAIKIIDKAQFNSSSLQKVYREVRIMRQLDHPNIVKLYEVIDGGRYLYLVIEYLQNGEMFEYISRNGKLKENFARSRFRQVVGAVQYLHARRFIHRDLKAENLLLDSDLNVKLCDFGFSNDYRPDRKLDTFCGSPYVQFHYSCLYSCKLLALLLLHEADLIYILLFLASEALKPMISLRLILSSPLLRK